MGGKDITGRGYEKESGSRILGARAQGLRTYSKTSDRAEKGLKSYGMCAPMVTHGTHRRRGWIPARPCR